MMSSSLPRWLQSFFWDARLRSISIGDHANYVLERLLEFGDWRALRWVFATYSRARVRAFLLSRGADVLSPRTWSFWSLYCGLNGPQRAHQSWRRHVGIWHPS